MIAQSAQVQQGVNSVGGAGAMSTQTVIRTIVNTLLFFIGTLAVIMIIYGGFKYVSSSGEASAVASAKNTILYAVIGIIVAALAYNIVDFVLDRFEGDTTNTTNSPTPKQAPKGVGPLPE